MRMATNFNAKDLETYLRDIDKYIDNRKKTLAEVHKPVEDVEELPTVTKLLSEVAEEKISAETVTQPVENVSEVVDNEITLEKKSDAEKLAELEEKISAPVEVEITEKVVDENLTVTEVVKKKSKKRKKKNKDKEQ